MIHNPEVNDQIRAMGIKFLSGKEKDADIQDLKEDYIVIIPALGLQSRCGNNDNVVLL